MFLGYNIISTINYKSTIYVFSHPQQTSFKEKSKYDTVLSLLGSS